MFFPTLSHNIHHHNLRLTLLRLENRRTSNMIMVVNSRNSVDRPNFPAVCEKEDERKRYTIKWFRFKSWVQPSKMAIRKLQRTKCIIPAAVNQTDINMETSWAKRIELDVFSTFKYCKMSGTVMRRSALKKRRPAKYWMCHFRMDNCAYQSILKPMRSGTANLPIHVRCKYIDTKDGGIVK